MPLQNRVDPFGDIHAVDARGLFTGNRGIIHGPATKTLMKRRWSTKAWIICSCEYRGIRREPMGRNGRDGKAGWTELFFLDEVTALAAGHRPCFTCRREQAKEFAACYGRAFSIAEPRAPEIDVHLHAERLASGGKMIELDRHGLEKLPDGAMIFDGEADHAIRGGKALRWSFSGYDRLTDFDEFGAGEMCVVTPATTLAVLGQGYRPVWHPSAQGLTG
ncbi:hypothetical protein [Mesorhizobium sp. KR9-304]|uniref:hypothetical protein n=1 Tax=Mesorhizobium sp. KR9-304 TaxID=3156614 RepID=UPI0032B55843